MKIVFVSNYINHHQIPLSDKLYELTGGEYVFVQTEPMEQERISMGWDADSVNKPYVKLYYKEKELCDNLIIDSDCVIFGGCENESIIEPRLSQKKFTLRYSERIYKEGRWKFVSPRGLRKKYKDHTQYRKDNVFMLCAGAFVKGDFSLVRAYTGKMLKFGYFPKTEKYDNVHELRSANENVEILWAGRFIDWKHPEMMIELARNIKRDNLSVHITMIGNGELFEKTVAMARAEQLDDMITFEGNLKPEEVRYKMRQADIFISTSDMKEGWGAVINEAMNSGCVVIASDKMGAVPYLITSEKNGFSYRAKSGSQLYKCVRYVTDNPEIAKKIGKNAYNTIVELWNSDVAAKRLYDFINDTEHRIPDYEDGPVSRA